ncbi:MAG: type IX secretion system sortase PorU, partial [Chitinophagales bacterium]|nr:type IX secretion system sortase PorU [Chitinophagales bacterium]
MKKFCLCSLLLVISFSLRAQIVSPVKTLIWSDTLQQFEFSDYKLHDALYFKGAAFDDVSYGYLPYFFESVQMPFQGTANITLSDEVYQPIALKRGALPVDAFNILQSTPLIKTGYGLEVKKPVAQISIVPFRKNPSSGMVEKLVSFRYNITVIPSGETTTRGEDNYALHSVLSSGNWYKISVNKDGIYKIDKSFLDGLGISTSSIDPHNIRIFGNGGGMLPEANAAFRYDDLTENPIKVVGEEDGHFDVGDYVLFYGQGPDRWVYDSALAKFSHISNLYSKETYYFVTTDLGSGKRIADQQSSASPANQQVSVFNDYAFHDQDLDNLLTSGRDWYGESFEFETSQSFPFSFPEIVTTTPVIVTATVASKSIYNSNTFSMSAAGQAIDDTSVPAICPDYTCPIANAGNLEGQFIATSGSFDVQLDYTKLAQDAIGWLNYIEVNVLRNLSWTGTQMNFRNALTLLNGNVSQFNVSNTNGSLWVWDVTNATNPQNQVISLNGSEAQFTIPTDSLHEFVIFANNEGYTPQVIGKISNQDLHGLSQADYLIIAPTFLMGEASDLANYHRNKSGMTVNVVPLEQVYNEFSSGATDLTAIRDFARMFYVRAGEDPASMPKYLCLFGDGSYDNKGNIEGEQGLIPTYQSANSLSVTSSFVSDDFFGLLDDAEGGNILDANAKLDLAVGRLPVNTTEEAASVVNKIKIYGSAQSFGNWRNVVTFVGDDEDSNTHIKDADEVAVAIAAANPVYNFDKIYLDAYQQVSIPGGTRYPDVNTAITNRISSGTLLINYVGHGGVGGWAHERILGISDIQGYTNLFKLPLFVTATCEFSKYDDPPVTSAGELLLLNSQGGAIALVTTVRLVYSSANRILNENFMENVFLAVNGIIPPLGEVFRKAKNSTGG